MSLYNCFDPNNFCECGIDEAGAGPLMGPVVAAAVIWPYNIGETPDTEYIYNTMCDSKKLTAKKRALLEPLIKKHAIDWSIGIVDATEVDEINVLQARIKAMHKAIDGLKHKEFINLLLVDGNRFSPYTFKCESRCEMRFTVPHKLVVKGDNTYQSIAAASILAKEEHDRLALEMHREYPQYGWDTNKGYGTEQHRQAIQTFGPTPYHRMTFLSKIL